MDIECKLKREGGSRIPLDNIEYHFAPLADGAHVAAVENEDHQDRFLSITEGYRLYRGGEKPVAAPIEVAPVAPAEPVAEPAAPAGLLGSDVHPASFDINGKTYSLGDVVALAHKGSGLDVQEWNELEAASRHDLIDEVLDTLEADTNGDGTVDNAEERAALVEQYKAKFNKSPGNMGVAKLREKLAAE